MAASAGVGIVAGYWPARRAAGLDPGEGASAILELSHVIQALFALNDFERGITVNVGTIDGGLRPNVVAPESQAVVDVRVESSEDGERIRTEILGLQPEIEGTSLQIEGGFGRPAMGGESAISSNGPLHAGVIERLRV